MRVSDLRPTEYAEFYANYIRQVPDRPLPVVLEDSAAGLIGYLRQLPEHRINHAYAAGKWTVKECLQHIIDTERLFGARALRLGRRDATPLPGFEQNDYAAVADVREREFGIMVEEFATLRRGNRQLFASFTTEDLRFAGTVSGSTMSCRAMGFIMCGHVYHHTALYRERYWAPAG